MLMLRFSVAAHRHEDLVAFLARAKPYYEEPGGIEVRLFRNPETPEQFLEMVTYRDEAAYRRDQLRVESDPRMKSLLEEWRSLHLGGVGVETYEEVVVPRL